MTFKSSIPSPIPVPLSSGQHQHYCKLESNKPLLQLCLQMSKNVRQLRQTHALLYRTNSAHPSLLLLLTYRLLNLPPTPQRQLPKHCLSYARQVFDQIPQCQNQFIWTSLIRSHTLHALHHHSLSLFRSMLRSSVSPSPFSLSSLIASCSRLPAPLLGSQSHALLLSLGHSSNTVLSTSLLDMYSRFGLLHHARRVFDEMPGPDVVAWTALLAALARAGAMSDARLLFDRMPRRNVVSWTAMVAGYANSGDVTKARLLFDQMPERNSVSWTAMIAGYAKCGDVAEARRVFAEARDPHPSCWAAMIACYAQNALPNEAVDLFWEMRNRNVEPHEVALVGVASACTQLGDPATANSVGDHVEESCSQLTHVTVNALINMYAKCSSIDRALCLFKRMSSKDVISYTTLITGLADHGRAEEALKVFQQMQKEGVAPNPITFVSVLNACSYVGLVDEGYTYFKLMRNTYGIVPLVEHYACMVDLLGRAGRLEEALRLIESMPNAPDAGVWGALLGACKVHCNVELGEIAAKHLFEIESENTGNYVLLSSIYASVNRWDDAERVRKMMSLRGMGKSQGCSWISR